MLESIKSLLASWGLFVARRYPDVVNGYRLAHDIPVLIRTLQPVCFDIGANKGQTIQQFQRYFEHPLIHAFEPATATYQALCKQSFGASVHIHQLALGEEVGTAEFRNYRQSELSSFLAMHPNRQENLFADEELLSIETVLVETLDHFCTTQAIQHIDLLKIDTQGFEAPVLRGATSLFDQQRIGAVLLELNFATLYEGQSDPLAILQFLRERGMRLVDFYEKERAHNRELSWTTALFIRYP